MTRESVMSALRRDLNAIITSTDPKRLLAVLPEDDALPFDMSGRNTARHTLTCTRRSGDQITSAPALRCYDLAIVVNTLELMDKKTGGNVIARLRDVYARGLYVAVSASADQPGIRSHWQHAELIAYGLRLVKRYTDDANPMDLYHYDIYDYKTTPDWLNPKHWANPDMWDKARW